MPYVCSKSHVIDASAVQNESAAQHYTVLRSTMLWFDVIDCGSPYLDGKVDRQKRILMNTVD